LPATAPPRRQTAPSVARRFAACPPHGLRKLRAGKRGRRKRPRLKPDDPHLQYFGKWPGRRPRPFGPGIRLATPSQDTQATGNRLARRCSGDAGDGPPLPDEHARLAWRPRTGGMTDSGQTQPCTPATVQAFQ
jgi:hypothetical protein